MYREEFSDKKAEVMLIKTELGIAKHFFFFTFKPLQLAMWGVEERTDGMNYIFKQPLTSHQTPWLLLCEWNLTTFLFTAVIICFEFY